jgi:lipid-binding SYLF domain-containing protein
MGFSHRRIVVAMATLAALLPRLAHADPDQTVRNADQVLQEVMAIPANQIPKYLLTQAQAVAIIPNVIKIGFVAAGRRGHGVVLIRDAQGTWGLPQFVTLTGGSLGWQVGVQGSDVVLVFMTRKSVENLTNGAFTIGADAAVAAGPVGRNAAAATDGYLKAEILSYSRSRGLFAGIALDGSVIEIDANSHLGYYGVAPLQPPAQVPESALRLRQDLDVLSQDNPSAVVVAGAAQVPAPSPTPKSSAQALRASSLQLQPLLDPTWQRFLALPREVYEGNQPPSVQSLQYAERQFATVAQSPQYRSLASRTEFQATHAALRSYIQELSPATQPRLALPPPPGQ